MANNTTFSSFSSRPRNSKRAPHSFRRPAQAMMTTTMVMPTNRKRKEVVELSSHKPQLSLLRDRDKLLSPRHHPVPVLEQGADLTVLPLKCHKEFHQFKSYDKITKSRSTCCNISSLPSATEGEKTNGYSNSANNCPMALSKYGSPSAPFFFLRLLKWTACPCLLHVPCQYYFWKCNDRNGSNHDDRRNDKLCNGIKTKIRATEASSSSFFFNSSNNKRNSTKFYSILILFFMCFGLFGHIIPGSHASPLPTFLSPTQTTLINMEYSENSSNGDRKYFDRLHKRQLSENPADNQENDEFSFKHHKPYMINNTIFDDGGDDHQVKEIKDETNRIHVNKTIGQSKGRNLYSASSDSKNKSGSEIGSSGNGNQLDFASLPNTPPELPNNSNNKNKMELWNKNEKGVLTTMPLAVKKRTEVVKAPLASSSSSPPAKVLASTFKQVTTAPVTNDLSQEMNESGSSSGSSSSENNGDDESSFVLINNSNDNNNYDVSDSITNVATTLSSNVTLGKCWTVAVEDTFEEMGEKEKSSYYSLLPMSDSPDPLFISSHADIPTTKMIGLMCNGTNDLAITLKQIPEKLVNQVSSIVVKDSLIYTLDLSLFHRFSHLENVSVTYSNITQIIGTCPVGLKALNISFNNIRKLNGSIFSMSGYSQSYDDEDEDVDHDDGGDSGNLEESTSSSDKIATNFSTELISSYFASEGEQLFELKKNKSDSMSQLLSLSPSPSSSSASGSSAKKIRDNSKMKIDSYPQKLIEMPSFLQTRTKKRPARFLSNEETQNDDLGNTRQASVTILNGDRRHHHLYQMRLIKTNVETGKGSAAAELEATLETGETNESNVDDEDSDDEEENEDGDDNLEAVFKKDNDSERNNSEEKITVGGGGRIRRRATPTESRVDFFAADKESNIDCSINNDSLCKSGKFVRRSRQVTREVNEDTDDGNDQPQKQTLDDVKRNRADENLKNDGYINERKEKEISNGQERNSYRSSTLSASRGTEASSIVNKGGENAIKVGSKPKPTLFPDGKRLSSRRTKVLTSRKRKARTSVPTMSSTPTSLSLEDIDLSHNKISEIPRALLQLKGLKSLHLSGNQLKCDFVWEKLAEWYMKAEDSTILKDGDDTFCGVVDDVRVFQFTVLGVLKAKKDLVETCRKVDKTICHECSLYSLNKQPGLGYNLSHQSTHGNVAIALKLDCSYRNLSSLPAVPPQTWQLNVSGNIIKDLIPLKEPMYENLLILDADSNEIDTLDGLTGTSFLDRYNILSLQNNRFSQIPSNVLSSLKNMRGQGVTFLGANFIDCDCDVVKDIKPLLLENSKQIKDLKEIYCKDMKARIGETYMAVKDLQFTDLCYMDSEESNEMYLYLVILVELLLIFVIVAKVWHDQRTFRRTGILPWCSAKMPRLPCDAMLESVKEPPHVNRSSSTNVRSYACEPPATQSISSCVQLRDVRSNSGQSEKSSQISQLSSFPCSSRTSSV